MRRFISHLLKWLFKLRCMTVLNYVQHQSTVLHNKIELWSGDYGRWMRGIDIIHYLTRATTKGHVHGLLH